MTRIFLGALKAVAAVQACCMALSSVTRLLATTTLWLRWAKVSILKIKSPSNRKINRLGYDSADKKEEKSRFSKETSPDVYRNPSKAAGRSMSPRRPQSPPVASNCLRPHLSSAQKLSVPPGGQSSPEGQTHRVGDTGTGCPLIHHPAGDKPCRSWALPREVWGQPLQEVPKRADGGGRSRFRTGAAAVTCPGAGHLSLLQAVGN